MSSFRVVLEDEAKRNVNAIFDWIAQRSVDGAERWYQTFSGTIQAIAEDGRRFAIAPESRHFENDILNATFRMRSGRTYRVLFTIAGKEAHVLYVRGPGQDWMKP